MSARQRSVVLCMACAMGCLLLSGCVAVTPSKKPYSFIRDDARLQRYYPAVYPTPNSIVKRDKASVLFSSPSDSSVRFGATAKVKPGQAPAKPVKMAAGVYPFQIVKNGEKGPMLSGAMMVYNLDATVTLATLGKTPETRIFSDELLRKAFAGQLANGTISIDDQEVITYWLGNRISVFAGGNPTVELDFSGTPGITAIKINGRKAKNQRATVPVYDAAGGADPSGERTPKEHRIQFEANGKAFHGYVRNLKANEFTAFVRIPCAIPRRLLDAAAAGTVARFTLQSTGDRQEDVAEIVISAE